MDNNNYKVYIHQVPNGKVYVGITKQDTSQRWNCGHGYDTQLFGRAVKKYGWNNITHTVLFEGLSEEEAKKKEIELIKKYDSTNPQKGYNCTTGGDGAPGHTLSEEERQAMKIRTTKLWQTPSFREHNLKHLERINKARIGKSMDPIVVRKSAVSRGKAVNRYTLEGEFIKSYLTLMDAAKDCNASDCSLIVACCKKNPRHRTAYNSIWKYKNEPLTNDDILWSNNINKNTWKPVAQYDLNGKLVDTFESVHEAERKTGISFKIISAVCKNHRVAKGFMWRFLIDENRDEIEPYKKPGNPVLQYTKNGEFVARYNNSREAGCVTGINATHINEVCHGNTNRKSAGGFIWRFENQNTKGNNPMVGATVACAVAVEEAMK